MRGPGIYERAFVKWVYIMRCTGIYERAFVNEPVVCLYIYIYYYIICPYIYVYVYIRIRIYTYGKGLLAVSQQSLHSCLQVFVRKVRLKKTIQSKHVDLECDREFRMRIRT